MPRWSGIEDSSAKPEKVWLARTAGSTTASSKDWTPLRKVDCQRLNRAVATNGKEPQQQQRQVYIESGRGTVDIEKGIAKHNFFRGHEREICSTVWFVREDKGKETILHPVVNLDDAAAMEALYQRAVEATSSLGAGISSLLKVLEPVSDGDIKIQKVGDELTVRKVPKRGWFSNSAVLQRGYGSYSVDGEDTETLLGPVQHCIFIVHGIGEALFSREDFKVAGLIEQINATRIELQKRQLATWRKKCEKEPDTPCPNRIELIPIEWFSHMHDSSSALMTSLKATTLSSIPALRDIANDVVFDVLMYLTPAFCESVLEVVTKQINELCRTFQSVHPDFANNGSYSLVGHSLGSVICWDLLAVMKQQNEPSAQTDTPSPDAEVGYQVYAKEEEDDANLAQRGSWGPTLPKPMKETIPFVPEFTLFLGSPLGLFLTLRGAHPVFDALRQNDVISPFKLPTKSLYNIFHPSDPVAYRIEPLLLSPKSDTEAPPPPVYLTVPGQDVRLHVKAMQLSDLVRKTMFVQKKKSMWDNLLETTLTALEDGDINLGNGGEATNTDDQKAKSLSFALGGKSSRVDYSIQPGVIENEYISAVMAHSSYFTNVDVQDFIIGLVTKRDSVETRSETNSISSNQ